MPRCRCCVTMVSVLPSSVVVVVVVVGGVVFRKVMLQSLAIQDLEIKHASNSRLSKLPTQPQTPCMTHSASGPGPLAALQPVSVRSRSSSDGSSIKGIQASASIQVLYDRSGEEVVQPF